MHRCRNPAGCDTLDQYKEEVKQKILAKKNRDAANEKEAKVLDKVIENATMDIADAQVEDMQKRMKDEFAQTLQYQGISLEQYMQIVNVTEESLMERIKPDALKRIQQRAVLEAVVKAENIEATDEEVDEELSKMAAQYQLLRLQRLCQMSRCCFPQSCYHSEPQMLSGCWLLKMSQCLKHRLNCHNHRRGSW